MIATHQVKNADKKSIGFMVDNVFYTNNYIRQNIQYIENLSIQGQDILMTGTGLPHILRINIRLNSLR